MYHRGKWNIILLAAGIGFVLSCLFEPWLIRLLIGAGLITIGLLVCR